MARKSKSQQEPALTKVQIRLFTDDVNETKRRAARDLVPWQIKARLIYQDAMKRLARGGGVVR